MASRRLVRAVVATDLQLRGASARMSRLRVSVSAGAYRPATPRARIAIDIMSGPARPGPARPGPACRCRPSRRRSCRDRSGGRRAAGSPRRPGRTGPLADRRLVRGNSDALLRPIEPIAAGIDGSSLSGCHGSPGTDRENPPWSRSRRAARDGSHDALRSSRAASRSCGSSPTSSPRRRSPGPGPRSSAGPTSLRPGVPDPVLDHGLMEAGPQPGAQAAPRLPAAGQHQGHGSRPRRGLPGRQGPKIRENPGSWRRPRIARDGSHGQGRARPAGRRRHLQSKGTSSSSTPAASTASSASW